MTALCRFEKRTLKQIDIYPVDLGFGQPRSQRGRPMLAVGELAKSILDRVARVSAPFGTAVQQQAGYAVIYVD